MAIGPAVKHGEHDQSTHGSRSGAGQSKPEREDARTLHPNMSRDPKTGKWYVPTRPDGTYEQALLDTEGEAETDEERFAPKKKPTYVPTNATPGSLNVTPIDQIRFKKPQEKTMTVSPTTKAKTQRPPGPKVVEYDLPNMYAVDTTAMVRPTAKGVIDEHVGAAPRSWITPGSKGKAKKSNAILGPAVKVWSDEAREASAEARRRHGGGSERETSTAAEREAGRRLQEPLTPADAAKPGRRQPQVGDVPARPKQPLVIGPNKPPKTYPVFNPQGRKIRVTVPED